METVSVTILVPKEGKEVVDALDVILEKVLRKASLAEYSDAFDKLYAAVDSVTGIKEEMQSQYRDELAGYLVHKMLGRLLPAAPVAP